MIINSLDLALPILKLISRTDILIISCEIALRLILEDLTEKYRKVSNIRCTLVGNKIVDHSDVIGASPVGAAPTTSSFST